MEGVVETHCVSYSFLKEKMSTKSRLDPSDISIQYSGIITRVSILVPLNDGQKEDTEVDFSQRCQDHSFAVEQSG